MNLFVHAFGLGRKPTPEDKARRLCATSHPLEGVDGYPADASLEDAAPPVMDQGQTSSCTGHATAQAIYVACAKAGQPLSFVPSPEGIYKGALCEEQPSGALQDVGCDAGDVGIWVQRGGVRPIQAPTPDGRYSDVDPSTIARRPTLLEDEASDKTRVVRVQQIDPRAADFLDQLAHSVGNLQRPLTQAIHATPGVMRWRAGDPALSDTSGATPKDGHDVVCLAYRTSPAGQLEFKLRSSWSAQFGDGGSLWVTGGWLLALCFECWRWDVIPVLAQKLGPDQETTPMPPIRRQRASRPNGAAGARGRLAAAAFALLLPVGCPSGPSSGSSAAAAAELATKACAALADAGCAEGKDSSCVPSMTRGMTTENRLTPAQGQCLTTATSKPSARSCAPDFVTCP
ncbi:MAG TPA: hypothetical protein VGI39_03210 [Polyangiaceae bacterium]